MADRELPVSTAVGESMCPFCEHFTEWHRGLPFNGTHPTGEWRYRCRQCNCTVDGDLERGLRSLDPDTYEPLSGVGQVTR